MFRVLTKRAILRIWARGFDAGIKKGYDLGYQMGKIEQGNRGFIIGNKPNIETEIEAILRDKRF